MDILSKLAPKPFEVDLELAQGAGDNRAVIMAETVTICMPTYLEWEESDATVKNPIIPHTAMDSNNKKHPNPYDPDYIEDLNAARRERQIRAVAFALIKGGNEIAGVTWESLKPDGKAIVTGELKRATEALQKAALGGFLMGIARVMADTTNMDAKRREVADLADRFHGAQASGAADLLADGVDADAVAGTA